MLEEQATDDPADEYLFFGETLSRQDPTAPLHISFAPAPQVSLSSFWTQRGRVKIFRFRNCIVV